MLFDDLVLSPVFDPYDLWSTSLGVQVKQQYYNKRLSGKLSAIVYGFSDWLFPNISRKIIGAVPRVYPIVIAQEILRLSNQENTENINSQSMLLALRSASVDPSGKTGYAWGLGFPWMSKNGLYNPDIPFVTHTPYVMEALLSLTRLESVNSEAYGIFTGTWGFLRSLVIMYEEGCQLALSYAPVVEPRIVVNANSYASFAYALHAIHGEDDVKYEAIERVTKLVNWIVSQQQNDGSWFYYADNEQGNFIDCFHSCFIIKNLIKVKTLIPDISNRTEPAIRSGWFFLRDKFYDKQSGLCRRFVQRDIKDPFRWDLYDQAEYLGLLVDFGLFDEAAQFAAHVENIFKKSDNWYCKIDLFGRRWGKNFLRWGIVPFLYHKARLEHELNMAVSVCAA